MAWLRIRQRAEDIEAFGLGGNSTLMPGAYRLDLVCRDLRQTATGMLQDSLHLSALDAGEPRQEFVYCCPLLEILKECADRDSRAPENPGAAYLGRAPLDFRAL